MRLLEDRGDGNLSLVEFTYDRIPPYAILSHTWGADSDEVSFKDVMEGTSRNKAGYKKIEFCREQAARHGLEYFWVDTCCIDKSSSAELTEAINSMFKWYRSAEKCYVYLSDVSITERNQTGLSIQPWEVAFRASRWFTRGWTLQELIAPRSVEFFSSEGNRLGDKKSLKKQIHEVTGVAFRALQGKPLDDFSVAERMSWTEKRETKRGEDMAYSLLGIFEVHIPVIYGEGKDNALRRLRKEIDSSLPSNPRLQPKASHPVPSAIIPFRRDRDFVERPLLNDILQRASEPGTRIGLVGLGGVGKSQIAIEYAYRVRERHPDTWVFWVHASSATRFEESYRDIAARLRLPGWDEPKADVLVLVHRWLSDERNVSWTMVVDNADEPAVMFEPRNGGASSTTASSSTAQSLSDFLPLCSHGSLVITSRSREVVDRLQVFSEDVLDVEPMEINVATDLFLKKLKKTGRETITIDMKRLVKHLDCMPLAITQAAACIEQAAPPMTVSKYMEILVKNESERAALLQKDVRDTRRDRQASNSIIMTLHMTFIHLRQTHDSAARLLALMSLFDREAIPGHLLQGRYAEAADSPNDFEDDIVTLRAYSLIGIGVNDGLFDMHRLVQLSIQKWLEMHSELQAWQERYIDILGTAFPTGEYANWTKCQAMLPHVVAMESYRVTDANYVQVWARTLYNGALYTWARGLYGIADQLARASLQARQELLGGDDAVTLDSLAMVALVLCYQGKYEQAEEMNRRALAGFQKVLGVDHPRTLTSMDDLTEVLRHQGKYLQAEEINQRALAGLEQVLGVDHPNTLRSMGSLASVLRHQGKYLQAEETNRRALAGYKKVLGADHPDTLRSMGSLALVLRDQGKYELAEELSRRALAGRERGLGLDHPDTLTSMSDLAQALQSRGKYEQAIELSRRALAGRAKGLGVDHPDTLTSLSDLAQALQFRGNNGEAEELSRRALAGRAKGLGVDHPDTLTSLSDLAQALRFQLQFGEAEELNRRALVGRERALGVDHPSTLTTVYNLGLLYRDLGELVEAERMFLRALAGRKQVLRPDHPLIFDTVNDLVNLYRGQGRLDEANQVYMQALAEKDGFLTQENPIDIDQSDVVDDDDALSEVSSGPPSLISDSSNSSIQDKYNDVVEHMVEIFCAEENIGLIYREAVQNFTADKFRHNNDQLLKLYFKQLRRESKTENEKATIRLLRTRPCRNEVTSLVLKFLQPLNVSGESRLTTSELANRKTERNYSLNQMLQGIAVDPESYNDHKKQHNGADDHEDDASESSESSTESEDEPLIENQQSPLQAIDVFLTSGKAFNHLKVNLVCLLHPPQSFKDALRSESIFVIKQYISRNLDNMADNDKEKVLKLRAEGKSSAQIAEFLLESTVTSPSTIVEKNQNSAFEKDALDTGEDTPKDKTTLDDGQTSTRETALMQFALTGQAKQDKPLLYDRPQLVTWTCSCGVQLYDQYTEIVPGSLEQLQQRLRQENSSPSRSWHTFWSGLVAWTTSRPSTLHSNSNRANTAPDTQTNQTTQEEGESAVRNIPGNAGLEPAAGGPPISGSTDTSNALQSPQPQVHPVISYLLLCFPEGLSGLRLHHQQIMHAAGRHSLPNQVLNDKQLFHLLRKKYASERRLFFSKFWPKTVIRVSLAYFLVDLSEYVELKHYACQDGQTNCKCIPPPDMIQPATNAQYSCVPREPPLKPPIGTNYLTHYFQNPNCIKSESLVCTLNQVPKRLGQCMPTSGSQRVEAWGMEFEEGWDRGRLRNAIFGIVVIGCLLFAILWSVLLKNLQSAFAVSSFIVAILATIGGYIASAEPRIVHK